MATWILITPYLHSSNMLYIYSISFKGFFFIVQLFSNCPPAINTFLIWKKKKLFSTFSKLKFTFYCSCLSWFSLVVQQSRCRFGTVTIFLHELIHFSAAIVSMKTAAFSLLFSLSATLILKLLEKDTRSVKMESLLLEKWSQIDNGKLLKKIKFWWTIWKQLKKKCRKVSNPLKNQNWTFY